MTSIAELEHRLQLAQEAEADAERSVRFHQFRARKALEALTAARIEQGEQ
ncbi:MULTISPECIES: hypothetical protein [unclassified Microbacterium]|nr:MULTISPECIES: hypothetical protein [unclassified Microbacterium]